MQPQLNIYLLASTHAPHHCKHHAPNKKRTSRFQHEVGANGRKAWTYVSTGERSGTAGLPAGGERAGNQVRIQFVTRRKHKHFLYAQNSKVHIFIYIAIIQAWIYQ